MPYLGNTPSSNFTSVAKDTFSGNASTTAFTLSKPATTNGVAVYVENVRQIPTTAYSVSGTTLTFTGTPPSGTNNIYVMHHNTPVSTATHPSAQSLTATTGTFTSTVDINGNELILDADADTSITADTDDRIDFRFGGNDSVHMDVTGVGVNVTNPLYPLHVNAVSGGDTSAVFLEGPNNGYSALYMGDTDDVDRSMILYGHANDEWKLFVGANKVFEIDGANRTIKFEMNAGNGNINAYNNNIYLASTTGEVYATDSGGNHTQLSPHNFKYIPDGASEVGAWAYMSEKTIPTKETVTEELPNGKSVTKEVIKNERKDGDEFSYVNVDMMKVVREVEKLTGTKLVYTGKDGKDDGSTVKDDIITDLIKRIEALENK